MVEVCIGALLFVGKEIWPEVVGDQVNGALRAVTGRVLAKGNHDLEKLHAASLEAALRGLRSDDRFSGPTYSYIEASLNKEAEARFRSTSAISGAMLFGDAETLRGSLETLFGDLTQAHKPEHIVDFWKVLTVLFLGAFLELVKAPQHEKGWKAFHRDLGIATYTEVHRTRSAQDDQAETLNRVLEIVARFEKNPPDPPDYAPALMRLIAAIDVKLDFVVLGVSDISGKVDLILALMQRLVTTPSPLVGRWTIPLPTAFFTGQEKFLSELAQIFDHDKVGAITQAGLQGFGGIGKTQLALEYARRNQGRYSGGGYFIVADSLAALDAGLARIADPDLPDAATGDLIAARSKKATDLLQATPRCLLILDNVDDIVESPEFQAVLDRLSQVHVLLTCRHRAMGEVQQVEIERMDRDTSALYVLRRGLGKEPSRWEWEHFRAEDRAAALGLADELDGFPLALDHVGVMIREDELNPKDALELYRMDREDILKNYGRPGASHKESAWVTTLSALQRLRDKNPAAAELVTCCAYLAPDAIIVNLFVKGWVTTGEPLASDLAHLDRHRLDALKSGLVLTEGRRYWLWMHRVTQAIIQDSAPGVARDRLSGLAVRADIALWNAGIYRPMLSQSEFARQTFERRFGDEDPDTLTSMNNLASAYLAMGRHADALALTEQTLAVQRRTLGDKHPSTLVSMSNLASTYSAMGRHVNALALKEQTLVIMRHSLGVEHPYTLTSMNNLADTYRAIGRLTDALTLHDQTLEIRHRTLGEEHPDTLISIGNLAKTYSAMGRHDEALTLKEQTLAIMRRTLGEEHPDTLTSLNNLATTLLVLGRQADAIKYLEQTLSVQRRTLGEDHPFTKTSKRNLDFAKAELAKSEPTP